MITKDNFKPLLKFLNFQSDLTNQVFTKTIGEATLKVDFDKKQKQIIYPEDKEFNCPFRSTNL